MASLLFISNKTITSLRNPMRTVETCDISAQFGIPDFLTNNISCRLHCEKRYINIDKNIRNANLERTKFQLKPDTKQDQKTNLCCCRFDTTWPDYVEPCAIGRKDWAKLKTAQKTDCIPLMLSGIRLSKRTVSSYYVLCSYLNKKIPLTMSELMDFVGAAAYLNYIQPKHPFIYKTIRLKEVSVISYPIQEHLVEVFENSLLDSYKPLEQYDGYKLEVTQIREFNPMIRKLAPALRSRVVAKAFDEYIISYSLVDIAAAYKYLDELNKSLAISDRILNGDYDKYNQNSIHHYFRMDNVNCRLVTRIEAKLDKYLSNIHSTLGTLYEKLIYEHMQEQYKNLQQLIHFKQIYRNIAKVNCR